MAIKILSIDWDYFADVSLENRKEYFITGNEVMPAAANNQAWAFAYARFPALAAVGVKQADIEAVSAIISKSCEAGLVPMAPSEAFGTDDFFPSFLIVEEHMRLYDVATDILDMDDEVSLEICNIDFHHDHFPYSGEVNSGNWATALHDLYPGRVKTSWIPTRDDPCYTCKGMSKTANPELISLEDIQSKKFDIVFVCRSSCWMPPHMDQDFIQIFYPLAFQHQALMDARLKKPRYTREFKALVEELTKRNVDAQLQTMMAGLQNEK